MGVYHNLVCNTCKKYLHFGKLLRPNADSGLKLQGLHSDNEFAWVTGERAWAALGQFLIEHQGHTLTFASDEVVLVQLDPYEKVRFDDLIDRAPRDQGEDTKGTSQDTKRTQRGHH